MVRIPPWRSSCLRLGFAFVLSLFVLARPGGVAAATIDSSESALLNSSQLVRAAVTQTEAAIAARVQALSGGRMTSPLALAPDRRDGEIRAIAEKAGIPMPDQPLRTPFGIWVDGSWSQMQVDGDGVTFDRQVWSGLGGVDYALND